MSSEETPTQVWDDYQSKVFGLFSNAKREIESITKTGKELIDRIEKLQDPINAGIDELKAIAERMELQYDDDDEFDSNQDMMRFKFPFISDYCSSCKFVRICVIQN